MKNRLASGFGLATLILFALAQLVPCSTASAAAAAAAPPAPTITPKLTKPLKAAQDAMAAKNWDAALAAIKEAQASPVEKSEYDNFLMNAWLMIIYQQKQDVPDEIVALQSAAGSQYATPDQQKNWLKVVLQLYAVQKDYPKEIEAAQALLAKMPNDPDTLTSIADAQNQLGQYKEAAVTVEQIVSHQDKPEEKFLVFQWNCYIRANDTVDSVPVIDKLLTFYPKQTYWQNATVPLQSKDIKDEHLQLAVYRLMNAVGVLKRPFDFGAMAELSLDLGYPGEGRTVLEQAIAQNVFSEQADKDRHQHMLDSAKQRATNDQASLPAAERDAAKAAGGDALIQIGMAYLTYGQADKAVADITQGIAKGGMKNPDEAYLDLGMAQLAVKNNAEAVKAFEKVEGSSTPDYARLGKLWVLHAAEHAT